MSGRQRKWTGASGGYNRPTFSALNRLRRLAWTFAWAVFGRCSPAPLFEWRAFLLRAFGAKIGKGSRIYPSARVWAPWLLEAEDIVAIAGDAEVYNPGGAYLGHHAVISQGAFLCGASHDFNDPSFPMVWAPIRVEPYAWICARAVMLPGVVAGRGAVLGAAAVATRDLEPWGVYSGNPAKKTGERQRTDGGQVPEGKSQ